MKFYRSIIATLVFMVLLALLYFAHIRYFKVNVVFYSAITDAVLAVLMAGAFLFACKYFRPLGNFEKLQLLLIWLLAGYAFAISVPTVIDRSLSFYILEKLQQRGGGIKEEKIKDVFVKEYLPEHRLVDVRLTEQLESGTIVIKNACVKLTPKGVWVASFGRFFRQNLLPKKRLLMGEYTDALTNPFKNSAAIVDYKCS